MRQVMPWWLRVGLSVLIVLLLWWPYAGWHWHRYVATGPGVWSMSPTGRVVVHESLYTLVATQLVPPARYRNHATWILSHAFATSAPAAVIGVLAYAAFTRRFGPKALDPESRCRRCRYILRGLTEPRCPECGERV